MKHLIAPLAATLLLAVSGFADSLERATELSVEMASQSQEAPEETAAAARGVGSLPEIAVLTSQQAAALAALADALDVSAERIARLGTSLEQQMDGLTALREGLMDLTPAIRCVKARLARLIEGSGPVPQEIIALRATISDLSQAQRRSVKHLKSINRKLAALGVIATAQGVQAPELPGDPSTPPRTEPGEGRSC